jgi:Galactosyltransferase
VGLLLLAATRPDYYPAAGSDSLLLHTQLTTAVPAEARDEELRQHIDEQREEQRRRIAEKQRQERLERLQRLDTPKKTHDSHTRFSKPFGHESVKPIKTVTTDNSTAWMKGLDWGWLGGSSASSISRKGTRPAAQSLLPFDYTQPAVADDTTTLTAPTIATRFNVTYVVLVLSARANFERRAMIRKTWGRDHFVLFVIGGPPRGSRDKVMVQLQKEQEQYGDLLDTIHPDSYQSLPYKVWFSYRYVVASLPSSIEWLIKVDDDTVVRVDSLVDTFLALYNGRTQYTVVGRIVRHSPVHKTGKWAEHLYRGKTYPFWPQGSCGHVVSRPVAQYLSTALVRAKPATPRRQLGEVATSPLFSLFTGHSDDVEEDQAINDGDPELHGVVEHSVNRRGDDDDTLDTEPLDHASLESEIVPPPTRTSLYSAAISETRNAGRAPKPLSVKPGSKPLLRTSQTNSTINQTQPLIFYQGEDTSLGIWLDVATTQLKHIRVNWIHSEYFRNDGDCLDNARNHGWGRHWLIMGHQISPEKMLQCYEQQQNGAGYDEETTSTENARRGDEWSPGEIHHVNRNFWYVENDHQRGVASRAKYFRGSKA